MLNSLSSFCQTDTKTVSSDTGNVVLPVTIVRYMAQDLVRYDACKAENEILRNVIDVKDSTIEAQEALTLVLRKKNIAYQSTIQEYQSLDEFQSKSLEIIKAKQKKTKRQRNVFIYFSTALIAALIVK